MSLLVPSRRFDSSVPEKMDRPGNDPILLSADLRVLENINRWLGGRRIPHRYISRLIRTPVALAARSRPNPLSILDLGTGAADVPRHIARWARRGNLRAQVTAVDSNPEILAIARERTAGCPEIRLDQQDLLSLPYATGSFDIVLCSLVLHHFSEEDAIAILRRIHDIARIGYMVNDLRRNRIAIGLATLMAHTFITNPIARFDAPASCERAFTVAELASMAKRAGLRHFEIHRHFAFRVALVGFK